MDERSERLQQRFEIPLTIAVLLVIPVMILRAAQTGEPWNTIGNVGDWLIWLTFLTEMVTMLAVVPSRRTWIRAHALDVAIVVLTPPFSVAVLQSIQLLRLLRLLRVIRLLQLLKGVFTIQGVQYAAFLAILTCLAGGQAFASAEDVPLRDGLYWAVSTMTTVGYGDFTPDTDIEKVVAATVMIVGVGFGGSSPARSPSDSSSPRTPSPGRIVRRSSGAARKREARRPLGASRSARGTDPQATTAPNEILK